MQGVQSVERHSVNDHLDRAVEIVLREALVQRHVGLTGGGAGQYLSRRGKAGKIAALRTGIGGRQALVLQALTAYLVARNPTETVT